MGFSEPQHECGSRSPEGLFPSYPSQNPKYKPEVLLKPVTSMKHGSIVIHSRQLRGSFGHRRSAVGVKSCNIFRSFFSAARPRILEIMTLAVRLHGARPGLGSSGKRASRPLILHVSAAAAGAGQPSTATQTVTVPQGSASLPTKRKERLVGASPIAGDPDDMKSLSRSLAVAEAAATKQQRGDGKATIQPLRQGFSASGAAASVPCVFEFGSSPVEHAEAPPDSPRVVSQREPPRHRPSPRQGPACPAFKRAPSFA